MAASVITQLDASAWKKAIAAGANALAGKRAEIDALNVFPVPDGDTGTNMSLTIHAAAKEALAALGNVCDIAKAASSGALRGARGNSGVILSQLFRGFAKGLGELEVLTTESLAQAMAGATQMAYTAVMKPREGTILTVARGVSEKATAFLAGEAEPGRSDIRKMLDACILHGRKVLLMTPELLPELKAAGVVDSGGEGFITMWEGIRQSLDVSGEIALVGVGQAESAQGGLPYKVEAPSKGSVFGLYESEDIKFPYDTELFIKIAAPQYASRGEIALEGEIRAFLDKHGDSIVVVVDGGLVKVHIHTDRPGAVLDFCMKIGNLSNIKIENMREQHSALIEKEVVPTKPFGFVAVSAGKGFSDLFAELGAAQIVEGGQTMNPSAEDILRAAEATGAADVFILPNNPNIILAAKQAAELAKSSKLHVVETRSMPEGVAALVAFVEAFSLENNMQGMGEAAAAVKTAQVTYAVRDTSVEGRSIAEGDILGIVGSQIVTSGASVDECALFVASELVKEHEFLSIYSGEDVSEAEAQTLLDGLVEALPGVEIEMHSGGQPLYYYIFAAE